MVKNYYIFNTVSIINNCNLNKQRALSDTDGDGKMDINEFSIACKLIHLKLRGLEVPPSLPPSLVQSLKVPFPGINTKSITRFI